MIILRSILPSAVTAAEICAISMFLGCRARVENVPTRLGPSEPKYLELCSLKKSSDSHHTVSIAGADGEIWYREAAPVIDLLHVQFYRATVANDELGRPAIALIIKDDHVQRLKQWSETHMGEMAGVVIDGKLRQIAPINAKLGNSLLLGSFNDKAEAERIVRIIRAGGAKS